METVMADKRQLLTLARTGDEGAFNDRRSRSAVPAIAAAIERRALRWSIADCLKRRPTITARNTKHFRRGAAINGLSNLG